MRGVESCDMRHHTLLHEVDLKFIERAKAKRESERVPDVRLVTTSGCGAPRGVSPICVRIKQFRAGQRILNCNFKTEKWQKSISVSSLLYVDVNSQHVLCLVDVN